MLFSFRPKRIVLLYITVLLLFTGSLYGAAIGPSIRASDIFTIYTRGVGQLGLSLLNIYLILLFLLSLFALRSAPRPQGALGDPVFPFLLFLTLSAALYSLFGISGGITVENILSNKGLFNFLNLLLLYLILKRSITDEEDIRRFEKVFVVICAIMALYGLVRIPLGGDPANYYAHFEKKGVSLSFFDFGQSALFCITVVMLYLQRGGMLKLVLTRSVIQLLCLANILLSYRRNCWVGLFLVFLWFLLTSNIQKKVVLSIIGCLVIVVGLAVYQTRFTDAKMEGKRDSIVSDLTSKRGELSVKTGRFAELYAAVMAASDSPLLGLGPWGLNKEFKVDHGSGPSSFVHSSLVHVYLKMGLVGLISYLLMLISYTVWWIRKKRQQWNNQYLKNIAEAFFCGFLFWIPDIVFGTPIIIYRHFQLLAIILSIPVIAYNIDMRLRHELEALDAA